MSTKRILEWTTIFGALSVFTFWVGATYAAPKQQLLSDIKLASYHSSRIVYFEDGHKRFEREEFACAITADQLHQLQAAYPVSLEQRTDDGQTITVAVVTVDGHGAKQLEQIVGNPESALCKHHTYHSFLYFFTVPSLS